MGWSSLIGSGIFPVCTKSQESQECESICLFLLLQVHAQSSRALRRQRKGLRRAQSLVQREALPWPGLARGST